MSRPMPSSGTAAAAAMPSFPSRRSGALRAPITPGQWPYWFHAQVHPQSRRDFVRVDVGFEGRLAVDALRQAAYAVVVRHAPLRTVFRATPAGSVEQVVHLPRRQFVFEQVEAAAGDSLDNWDAAQDRLNTIDTTASLDLARGPVARFILLTLGPRRALLRLLVHHMAMDGWSRLVYVRDLSELYCQATHERAAALSELPIEYADYSVWTSSVRRSPRFKTLTSYWQELFTSSPARLHLGREVCPPRSLPILESRLDAWSFERLATIAAAEQSTRFRCLLSLLQLQLRYWGNSRDVLVGLSHVNRAPGTHDLVGLFADTLPLRLEIDDSTTVGELLRQSNTSLAAAIDHGVSFSEMQKLIPALASVSLHSPIQVLLNLQKVVPEPATIGDLEISFHDNFDTTTSAELPHELMIYATKSADGSLRFVIRGNPTAFSARRMEEFAEHYTNLARVVASAPSVLTTPIRTIWNAARAGTLPQ